MQQRRSVWFWVTLAWLVSMLFANLYDERLVQSSTFLGGDLGNLIYLVLLLGLTYVYPWSHRYVAGVLAALGVLALVAAVRTTPSDAAVGLVSLGCAAGLWLRPFRTASRRPAPAPRPPQQQRYRRRDA